MTAMSTRHLATTAREVRWADQVRWGVLLNKGSPGRSADLTARFPDSRTTGRKGTGKPAAGMVVTYLIGLLAIFTGNKDRWILWPPATT